MAIKSSRGITSGKGIPQNREGYNGDITIRSSALGRKLYVKDTNNWHSINLNIDTRRLEFDVGALINEVRRLKNKIRNKPILDAAFFRVPGSANVQLKNVGAVLKVRNAADTGDAKVIAKELAIQGGPSGTNVIGLSGINHSYVMMEDTDGVLTNDGNDLYIRAGGAFNYVVDSGAPVNKEGGHLYLQGGQGTGVNCGGDIIFNVSKPGADGISDNVKNGFTAAGRINGDTGNWEISLSSSGNDAEDSTAMDIGWIRTVATSGTAAHNDIGLNLDIDSRSLGTSTVKGIVCDVDGHTDGTHTATGIDINVASADKNHGLDITVPDGANDYHIRLIPADNVSEYGDISVADTGDMTIKTVGDGTTDSDITLDADGRIILEAALNLTIEVQDGSQDNVTFKGVGADNPYMIFGSEEDSYTNLRMHEMGGSSTNDYFNIIVEEHGETSISTIDSAAANAHLNIEPDGHVEFDGCAVGFDRTLYADATNVTVDFRTGNKAHLDMTGGSISGTLTLRFPATSGNFLLVVEQDGSTRTIAAYATKDAAGNAGNNDGGTAGAVRWAGGSNPTLTAGGSKRDIMSFYWDADEEVCYATITQNF